MNSSLERIENLQCQLSVVGNPPAMNFDSPYQNLRQFVDAYREVEGKKLLIWAGLPGSGKTRFRSIAKLYRQERHLHATGTKLIIGTRTWEVAEDLARLAGEVETDQDKPYEKSELAAVSQFWEGSLHDVIKKFQDAEGEAPVITSINIAPKGGIELERVGRELGYQALYHALEPSGDFRLLPEYQVWIAGLVAGPYLRMVIPLYRRAIRTTQSLKEAVALSRLCGLEPPRSLQQLRLQQSREASPEQIALIRDHLRSVVIPAYQHRNPQEIVLAEDHIIEADHMNHVFTDPYNLGFPDGRNFIGYNDLQPVPSLDRDLLNDWLTSEGTMRLAPDHIDRLTP